MRLDMYYFFSKEADIKGPVPRKGKTKKQSYLLERDPESAVKAWKQANGIRGEAEGFIYVCREMVLKTDSMRSINNAYRSEVPLEIIEKRKYIG